MGNIETRGAGVDFSKKIARKITFAVLSSTILKAETTDNYHSVEKARELIKSGYGLIVMINHFSLKDPPLMIDELLRLKDFQDKKIIAPIAYHMDNGLLRNIFKIIDVSSIPIVTKSTIDKGKNNGLELNDGMVKYMEESLASLKNGQTVVFAPQGTRKDHLGQADKTTVGTLMAAAAKSGVDKYAALIVGLGIKGETDYSDKNGFNPLQKYTVNFGACLTSVEILAKAEELAKAEAEKSGNTSRKAMSPFRFVDKVIYEELGKVVPPSYR